MVIMCCWKSHWFNQIFHCKTCSLWLQNVTTLKLWPALQEGRPSLNWVMVLSWLNRAHLFVFFFLFDVPSWNYRDILQMIQVCIIWDLTGTEEGSKIQTYNSPRATQQSSHLFPCFSLIKYTNSKPKKRTKSFILIYF